MKGPTMSIRLILATIALGVSVTSAQAMMKYPYGPNDQSYRDAMETYGQEMTTAKYAVRYCPETISYNSKYFDSDLPNLWDAHRFKSFMTVVATSMKERLDEYHAEVDTDNFCKMLVEFMRDNYPPNKMPILITEK